MNRTRRPLTSRVALLAVVAQLFASSALAGDRQLRTEGVVDATPHELWEAFTTDSGITQWMVPFAHIDLRVGGTLETSYDPHAKLGDPKNIHHTILSFEPDHMFSFTFTMPAMFKRAHDEGGHWVVVRFEALAPKRTLVTETIYGMGEGADWDKAYAFFERGDADTMVELQKRFAPKERPNPDRALAFLRGLAGGIWTAEQKTPDGGAFRAKFLYESSPEHPFLTAKGWLGDAKSLALHGVTIAGKDAKSGEILQTSCLEDGSVARMTVTEKKDGVIELGDLVASDGKSTPIRQELTAKDANHLDIRIDLGDEKDPKHTVIELAYTRVARDPELEFLLAKSSAAK